MLGREELCIASRVYVWKKNDAAAPITIFYFRLGMATFSNRRTMTGWVTSSTERAYSLVAVNAFTNLPRYPIPVRISPNQSSHD
eukprot:scaffold134063_cov80-Attheya_sp.AAC.1